MSTLDDIRRRLPVPEGFGAEVPYARFSRIQDDRRAGEDITLEFQTGEEPGDADQIVFSHSEWQETARGTGTRPLCTVALDATSGEPLADSEAVRVELAVRVREALAHADQLELVGR